MPVLKSLAVSASFFLSVALPGLTAQAQVVRYDLVKTGYFAQLVDSAHDDAPYSCNGGAYVVTVNAPDTTGALASNPAGFSSGPFASYIPGFWTAYLGGFNSLFEMEAAIPPSSYKFSIFGGVLGNVSANLNLPAAAYPLSVPYVTGDGFSRMQNLNPAEPFVFTIDPMVINPGCNESTIVLDFSDACSTSLPFVIIDPPSNTITIPAHSLLPARHYVLSLTFSNSVAIPNAGFGAATSRATFASTTLIEFTTAYNGCLADLDSSGEVDLLDFFTFFNCFDVADSCADLDGCEGTTLDDFFLFFNAWDQSCP